MRYFTYILQSGKDQNYYIGQTNNLKKRQLRHNLGHNKSTKSKVPWKLLWFNEFETRGEAMRYEKKLKDKKLERYWKSLLS